ncbi:hypothetical protein U1Q18_030329 [Sarracenia purpurea var. burkii]
MASAQVLPNSAASTRKQEHLEAGKRRLEEFRKKKAADRAKKTASASELHTSNVDQHDKQSVDDQHVRLMASNGAGTSGGVSKTVIEPARVVTNDENKTNEFSQNIELGSDDSHANSQLPSNYYNAFYAETVQVPAKDPEFDRYHALHSAGTVNANFSQPQEKHDNFHIFTGAGIPTDQSVAFGSRVTRGIDGDTSQPNLFGLDEAYSKDNDGHVKDFTFTSPATSHSVVSNLSSENSGSFLPQNKFSYTNPYGSGPMSSLYEDTNTITNSSFEVEKNMYDSLETNNTMRLDMGERKLGNSVGHFPSANSGPLWPSESRSTAFSFGINSSSNHVPLYPVVSEPDTRRSRPSFLDSINMSRVPVTEPESIELFSSKVHDVDVVTSSASQKTETNLPFSKSMASNVTSTFEHSMTSSDSTGNGGDMYRRAVNENSMEWKHDSNLQKQYEDFSALEQHIEDLTQEKFSLQRALEASRALADSLAAENSALTDSYNQQRSTVNQLKSDMEKSQEEIKAQLVELESVKMEYANAQLECIAADERAKLLASEVIGLEEKALRLRSSELKLERQLENSQSEISSFKRKMSSFEKERQDLQMTIDALQEEKKLLQAKLRKASANGKLIDVSKTPSNKKDVSTSTEDLISEDDMGTTAERSNLEMHSTAPVLGSDSSSSFLLPEDRQSNLEVSYLNVPPDQMRTIQNINTLISELALEKEELMKTLQAESSESFKLKELNKELSRTLEAQTQRLELLTAQNMANANIPIRSLDSRGMHDNTQYDNTTYADEGDEVVERVLGWIMKLFPGGPSRRRTSKLL